MSMPAESMSPGITLPALLPDVSGVPEIEVAGIASDSRLVADGYLFLATAGGRTEPPSNWAINRAASSSCCAATRHRPGRCRRWR